MMTLLLTVVLLGMPNTVLNDSTNISTAGVWPFGLPAEYHGTILTGNGDTLFLASGTGILIFDVSQGYFTKLGEIHLNPWEGFIYDIFYSQSRLFIAFDIGGVRIWDVSNPQNPRKLGIYNTNNPNDPYTHYTSVFNMDNYLYVAEYDRGGNDWLEIIDISDPSNPHLLNSYRTAATVKDIYLEGNYAYLLVDGIPENIEILDISNPSNPVQAGIFNLSSVYSPLKLVVEDTIVYETYIDFYNDRKFAMISVANPQNPSLIRDFSPGFTNFQIEGENMYATDGFDLFLYAILGDSLELLARTRVNIATDIDLTPFYVNNGTIYTAYNPRLPTFSYSDWGIKPFVVSNDTIVPLSDTSQYTLPGYTYNVKVSGNYLYVANGGGGLRIIDISNPEYPVEISHLYATIRGDTLAMGTSFLTIRDTIAFLFGFPMVVRVNISNPLNPRIIDYTNQSYNTNAPMRFFDVALIDDYAYALADMFDNHGLNRIYKIDLNHITIIDSAIVDIFYAQNNIEALTKFKDLLAYITSDGLYILDPNGFQTISSLNIQRPYDIDAEGDFIYITTGNTLMIIDAHDSTSPYIRSALQLFSLYSSNTHLVVESSYAYVLTQYGIYVVDISNPDSPNIVGYYGYPLPTALSAYLSWANIDAYENNIYVACGNKGVTIYSYHTTGVREDQSENILISHKAHIQKFFAAKFNVKSGERLDLRIINTAGRTVWRGEYLEGEHAISLRLPAGIYYLRGKTKRGPRTINSWTEKYILTGE